MTCSAEPAPPRMLFWETTSRCNLACKHCRRMDADGSSPADLTTDEARRLMESAARLGKPVVVFSGGEPLLRDDWHELANYACELRLPTALATNGTLIDDFMGGRIGDAGFRRVSVSLDGADSAVHDAFRGLTGAFDLAVAGIGSLRRSSVPVQVNATVARHNFAQLDAIYALAAGLGAEALHLFVLVPVGCGAEMSPSEQLSPAQYEHVLEWVCRRQVGGGLEVRATCAPAYQRVARRLGVSVRGSRGCLCGTGVVFVSHEGLVFPCGYLPLACGDVRKDDIGEIWRNSHILQGLRELTGLAGKCGDCEYATVCAGCRARALADTGDWRGEDPVCAYRPGVAGK